MRFLTFIFNSSDPFQILFQTDKKYPPRSSAFQAVIQKGTFSAVFLYLSSRPRSAGPIRSFKRVGGYTRGILFPAALIILRLRRFGFIFLFSLFFFLR